MNLYIWTATRPIDIGPLRIAKSDIGFTERIDPVFVEKAEDVPEFGTRVLAIGSRPPFLCEYALTSERTSPDGWCRALSWSLGLTEFDPKATTLTDTLTAAFGPGVREIPAEEIEAHQRLRDYQQNRD